MAQQIIHGHNINYDEQSTTATNYMSHLENSLTREEVEAFLHQAKNDPYGKVHLEDHHGDKVTLVYNQNDGSYLVRKTLI